MQTQNTDSKTKNTAANNESKPNTNEQSRPTQRPNDQFNWDAWWNEYYETHE